ncbi:MAG: methylmalonyl-CoA mutase family protein [Proteobacteria bacterium]|nr:methylmalonyl-CoA mutase family protein [Pseudomonadota bacterium]
MKKAEWLEKYKKTLEKFPERKKEFLTGSATSVNALYTPEDIGNKIDDLYSDKIGFPGEFPYTRGVQSTMYRGRFWTMRQYAGFGDAEESNKRYHYLLNSGQTGLSIAFDLPTQIGYDSDDPVCKGEVGKVGVAIDSLKDMEILFKGIPVDKVSTSMTINAPAAVLLAMYIVNAEKQGINRKELTGTIQNDILKEYIARGTYIYPPAPSMRLITDIFEFCSKEVPKWNTISISGYHIREAGSSAAQEVGFTLADGVAYVDAAIKVGLGVDDFAPRLSFFFNSHNDLLEEVAKFRAARRIWANIMKNRFKSKDPKSMRTQQIIAEESGITNTVDPLAGSYYVEALTDQIEKVAMEYIQKIDDMGGVVKAIERGYIQKEIQDSSYKYQQSIEKKERIVVGVNKYTMEEKTKGELLRVNPAVEAKQVEKLRSVKASRSNKDVELRLAKIREAAKGNENLMPPIIDAVRDYATIGEICGVMREVFGEYKERIVI